MAYPVIRAKHRVTRGYTATHKAVDIAPHRKGTPEPIYAVGAGTISHVGVGSWMSGRNFILQLDGDGSLWWYTHLSTIGSIRKGHRFEDGEQLGGAMTGNTGFSFGVHLHLVRFGKGVLDNFTDPWPYIKHAADPGKPIVTPKPPAGRPSAPAAKPGKRRVRLTNWTVYGDKNLRNYLGGGLRVTWTGVYDIEGIDRNGNMLIRGGDGRQAWVHKSAQAGIIG